MNIKDIAKQAGVSISSVSRVLNHQPGVKPEIRDKIQNIIHNTGYTPNLLARGLVQQRSRTIGVILPYVHSHWMERINAIMDYFQEQHYSVMFNTYQMDWNKEQASFQFMQEKQVDGVIYFPDKSEQSRLTLIEHYLKHFPVVVAEQKFSTKNFSQVLQDNYQGACLLTQHLVDQNHKKIALLCGPLTDYSARERKQAFLDILKQKNIPFNKALYREGDYSLKQGYRMMKDILSTSSPTAVFAMNDLMALGALRAINEADLSVPRDISLAGYDDIKMAAYSTPSLCTVQQEHYNMGKYSAELLLSHILDKDMEPRIITRQQQLVLRESVGTAGKPGH